MTTRGDDVGRSMPVRIAAFQAGWSAIFVGAIAVAQFLVPSETTVPFWYVAAAPVSWILIGIATLPLTIGIVAAIAMSARRTGKSSRALGFAVSVGVWAIVLVIAAWTLPMSRDTQARTLIAVCIAVPAFGLLVPLPPLQSSRGSA